MASDPTDEDGQSLAFVDDDEATLFLAPQKTAMATEQPRPSPTPSASSSSSSSHRRHRSAEMVKVVHSEPAMVDHLLLSPSSVSEWAPRKFSEGNIGAAEMAAAAHSRRRSPAKRKLSESRGVHLPDIRILQGTPPSSFRETKEERKEREAVVRMNSLPMQTPPLTSSPVSHMMRRIPLTVNTSAPIRSSSPGSTKSNVNAVINICVFLPDNRGIQFAVEGGRVASAQCLMEMVCEHLEIALDVAMNAFALWMMSPLLELQLKPHHVPCDVRRNWAGLLKKFTSAAQEEIAADEPLLVFRRNVLLSLDFETELYSQEKATEMLFLDAKDQLLSGRYVCDAQEALHLAAIDMALTLGPFNPAQHTFFYIREALEEFLPEQHVHAARSFSLFGVQLVGCRGWEQEVMDDYRQLSGLDAHSLRVAYLNVVSRFPFYGAAFFHGQIERPLPKDIRRLLRPSPSDMAVLVGVNRQLITVIDRHKHTLLLSQPIVDCSWRRLDCADPPNPDALPSFFLHFPDDNGEDAESGFEETTSKLLQIFSRQAVMIEALLNAVYRCYQLEVEDDGEEDEGGAEEEEVVESADNGHVVDDRTVGETGDEDDLSPTSSITLSNKLDRLCLATFDASGRCVEAQGSLRRVVQPLA